MNIPKSDIEKLYIELTGAQKKILAIQNHLDNLNGSYQETIRKKKHSNNRGYHLRRIELEMKIASNGLKYFHRRIEALSAQIYEEEIVAEKERLRIQEESLEKERLLTLEFVKRSNAKRNKKMKTDYDVFISHSTEDKDGFVRPLANELKNNGVKVWYDEFELKIGDSLREGIDRGLRKSKFGIIVLSNSFFSRGWTNYELNGFVSREMKESKVILPIWHKVTKDEVVDFSPTLADKVALNSSVNSIKEIAKKIKELI